eukprot:2848534-Amphidinium_carterae.2
MLLALPSAHDDRHVPCLGSLCLETLPGTMLVPLVWSTRTTSACLIEGHSGAQSLGFDSGENV